MADPIIISQIIASEGLTGDKAKSRRAQLEKMPSDQLMSLLSNIQKAKKSDVKGFGALNPNNAEGGRSEGLLFGNSAPSLNIGDFSSFTSNTAKPEPKKYYPNQEKELRFFAADYLAEACDAAVQSHNKYIKSIGVISSDALWHGMKNIANAFDVSGDGRGITTLDEQAAILNTEYASVQKIKKTKEQKGNFEFTFQRERGMAFNPENVEKFKSSSETYLKMSAYDEKYKSFTGSMKELRKLYAEDKALEAVRKTGRPVPNREKTFDAAVVGVIDDFCSGDEDLRNKFIEQLSGGATNKDELKANFMKNLEGIEKKFAAEYNQNLGGKTIEQYKSDYENKFKGAFGKENVKELTESYIERQKMGAQFTEIGVTIATSFLLPGSGLVAGAGSKLALKVGEKAAAQIVKGAMLTTTASVPAALTFTGAVTSEEGLTDAKKAEIGQKFKNGIMYGGFGAYASGPLGQVIGNIVKVKPNAFSGVLDKAFATTNSVGKTVGALAETSADVIFDRMTSDLSISESMSQNGLMNMGMMFAGGRLAKLQGIKVEKVNDNTFNVKDADGKALITGGSANEVGAFVLAKASEGQPAPKQMLALPPAKEVLALPPAKEVLALPPAKEVKALPPAKEVKALPPAKEVKAKPAKPSRPVVTEDEICSMNRRLLDLKGKDGKPLFTADDIDNIALSGKTEYIVKPLRLLNDDVLRQFSGNNVKYLTNIADNSFSQISTLNSVKPELLEALGPGALSKILSNERFKMTESKIEILDGLDAKVLKSFKGKIELQNYVMWGSNIQGKQHQGIDLLNSLSSEHLAKMPDEVKIKLLNYSIADVKGAQAKMEFIGTDKFEDFGNDVADLMKDKTKFDDAELSAYILATKMEDIEGLSQYIKKVDIDKLCEMEPRIASFGTKNMLDFLTYHQKNGTEISPEALTYQGNLTHHLKKELVSAQNINKLLSAMPSTDRRVGGLPDGWLNNISQGERKAAANAVYESINKFMLKRSNDKNSSRVLGERLTKTLNQPVKVKELGSGAVGTGYRVTVGDKDFVLKGFDDGEFATNAKDVHGRSIEPSAALYAQSHSNKFVDFYFGKLAGENDVDGFIVTEFLTKTAPDKTKTKTAAVNHVMSSDVIERTGHNMLSGKVIDFGELYKVHPELEDKGLAQAARIVSDKVVMRKNGQYHMTDKSMQFLEDYIGKNKNNPKFIKAIELIQKDFDATLDADTKVRLQELKKSTYIKNLDPSVKRHDAHFAAYEINKRISENEDMVVNFMRGTGLTDGAKFQHRTKGVTSLYNKLCKNLNKGLSLEAATAQIQDGLGTRTVLADYDYKQDPEIVAMLKTNPKKAYEMAAARQSDATLKSVYNVIDQQAVSGRFEAMTVENYKGKDGIPYFSDEQVASLQDYAVKKGVTLDIEATSKVRDSGYSALQMNFKASDGTVLEWQMRGGKVDEFAECEHVIYDIKQKKDVTGGNSKLNNLYAPYEPAIRGLDDVSFKEYMEYLTDHYLYLRKGELGFDAVKPELPKKFNPILSADALVELHNKKMKVA